ncbi:hypothetical protein [Halocatena pleomorpha]|nr:hypothetical protein [Halocatena pleomorpha]
MDSHRKFGRQLYNHVFYWFNLLEDEVAIKQRVRKIRDEPPDLKDR